MCWGDQIYWQCDPVSTHLRRLELNKLSGKGGSIHPAADLGLIQVRPRP